MLFADSPVSSGSAISATPGASSITLNRVGFYHTVFHTSAAANRSTCVPATLTVQLYQDGVAVPGASASHSYTSTGAPSALGFTFPVEAKAPGSVLQVRTDQKGFSLTNSVLTVMYLGSAENP